MNTIFKKFLSGALTACMLAGCLTVNDSAFSKLVSISASAEEEAISENPEVTAAEEEQLPGEHLLATSGWNYSLSSGKATITGCSSASGALTIPSTIGGYTVTAIGSKAFYDNDNITSVTIPGTVTTIGDYAFRYCSNLTFAYISQGVQKIGVRAFCNCPKLKSVYIAPSVVDIGDYKPTSTFTPNGSTFEGHASGFVIYGAAGSHAAKYARVRNITFSTSTAAFIPAATKINASSATADGVILAWDVSSGATSYRIYRATSAYGDKVFLKSVSNTFTVDNTAVAGMSY